MAEGGTCCASVGLPACYPLLAPRSILADRGLYPGAALLRRGFGGQARPGYNEPKAGRRLLAACFSLLTPQTNFARTSASECSTDFPELRRRRRSLRTRRCQAGEGITESCACNEAQRFSIAANRSGRLIFSISVGVIGGADGGGTEGGCRRSEVGGRGTEGLAEGLAARDALLALIGPIGDPDQRGSKFRQEFKMRIHCDQPEPVLEGKSGNPEVGIG